MAATGPEDSEASGDELAELATLLARAAVEEDAARATPPTPRPRRRCPDGRSKHATFERWLREHTPLVYYGLYAGADDVALAAERRRRRDLERLARVRRDALAYCIECRHPLLATELGFQFCPYERAGQHEKLRRALLESTEAPGAAVVTLNADAARWRRRAS